MALLQTAVPAVAAAFSATRGELAAPAGLRLCPIVGPANCLPPLSLRPRTDRAARRAHPVQLGLGVLLLFSLVGCVGYVDGGYGGGAVVVPGPDYYFFGGGYEHRREIHEYHDRGAHSREVAHPRGRGDKH